MTQPGACRNTAGPKRDARADAPKVEQTVGSDRLPAAPLSSENFQGPEVLRPRLTAGLPLSAFGQKAAVYLSRLDRHRQGVLRCISVPEASQSCTARAKYRYTHTRNKGEFVAHRRHNSSCACGAGHEFKSYQRRADEISPARLRLMSHALRWKIKQKKEAGFPAPLTMTTEVYFVFFLATAITCAQSVAPRFALQPARA